MSNLSVPDLLSFSRLSQSVSDLKSRVETTRTEAVTGRYEDVTTHLNGDVGGAHLLRKAIDDARLFQQNLAVAGSRAQVTQATLGNIGTDSSRIATDLTAAVGRGDQSTVNVMFIDAKAALIASFGSLNAVFSGRALFGGDGTDRPPLAPPEQMLADIEAIMVGATDAADAQAQIDFYFDDPAGGFATSIYLGGANRAPGVEITAGTRVDASAKADDPALKNTLRGLVTIAAAKSATFSDVDNLIVAGANEIFSAESDLISQRAAIGVNEGRIADSIERNELEESVLTALYNKKTLRDPFEAASELQLLETQLEASYLMTSRMARLSLTNYIR